MSVYRDAPPEQPKERALEVRVTRASPLMLFLFGVWLVPLGYGVNLAAHTTMWWIAPIFAVPIFVVIAVFMIPIATDRYVRIEPSRDLIVLQRRFLGLNVRVERHPLAKARSVDVQVHEWEDESPTSTVHLVFEGGDPIELGQVQGDAVARGEIETAARAIRAYLFPPS